MPWNRFDRADEELLPGRGLDRPESIFLLDQLEIGMLREGRLELRLARILVESDESTGAQTVKHAALKQMEGHRPIEPEN